jgi:hypothetical protein
VTPPTIGDLNPEVAKKYGLDVYQAGMLTEEVSRWDGRVTMVTFVAPPPREDGKSDPIAYLPPTYRKHGIVDRDHRNRVNVGETWLVEVVEKGTGAFFLIPLFRLDLKSLLDLQPERMKQLAEQLASKNLELGKALADKIPKAPSPEVVKELETARSQTNELRTAIDTLRKEKTSLETKLEHLEAQQYQSRLVTFIAQRVAPSTSATKAGSHLQAAMTTSQQPPSEVVDEMTLRRVDQDICESKALIHNAYEIHFTADLYRVVLKPNRGGVPCKSGRLVVQGLSRVDSSTAPTTYNMAWDERFGGFVAYIGQPSGTPLKATEA